jgi:hypothetical protein
MAGSHFAVAAKFFFDANTSKKWLKFKKIVHSTQFWINNVPFSNFAVETSNFRQCCFSTHLLAQLVERWPVVSEVLGSNPGMIID